MEETKVVKFEDWYKVNMPQVPPPGVDERYEASRAAWMAAWEEQELRKQAIRDACNAAWSRMW